MRVDNYEEVYYDFDYRHAAPGHLSKWIRASYADGTLIDINIDEISEDMLSADDMRNAIMCSKFGRGGRVFPNIINRQTSPRLYAARRSVLEAMDQFNLNFIMATLPAVFFIITLPIGAAGSGGSGRATRTARPRPSTRISPGTTSGTTTAAGRTGTATTGGAATTQTAEQIGAEIGAEIGASVTGRMTGKMADIATQVSGRGLSQEAAATATEAAVRTLGLRVGPRVALPNGNAVVTSVQLGTQQPVLVVRPDGGCSVLPLIS